MADSEAGVSGTESGESQTRREFTWSDDIQDVASFQDDRLPCVVRMEEKEGVPLSPGLRIYTKQPILFHTRTSKKVGRARTIHKDENGMYFEIGQTLLLPEDYQGWFEMVPPDFGRATCFRSIAEVADAMPRKFFTRSNMKAIRIQKEEEGEEQKIFERKIPAGSVLGVESIFTATWKTSAVTGVFKKKNTEWATMEVKYLKCIDTDQMEILLPLTQKGKFNALYEKGKLNKNSVYRIKDILSDLTLPVKARLLFGKAPVVPCIFTGMMVISAAEQSESIVGSTVLNKRNVLFEVPVTSPCSVRTSANEKDYTDLDTFKDAQKLCKKYALAYSMMMKLSPEMDTGQKVIQHVPRGKTGDTLTLDLITDISLTDDPVDRFMESDTDSIQSEDQTPVPRGMLIELKEFRSRESYTQV